MGSRSSNTTVFDYHVTEKVDTSITSVVLVLYCIVSVVGVCGNTLTILSILLNKKLKSIPNVYIGNLAIADSIVCAVIAPFSAIVLSSTSQEISSNVCIFIGALNAAMLGSTMFNLAAIAVNRYVLVVKGSSLYTKLYTRRRVIISIVILWLLPVLLVLPGLLGLGRFGYNTKMGTCIFISYDKMTYIYVQGILHGVCVAPSIFITVFSYVSIIIYFRKAQNRLKMSAKKSSHTPTTGTKTDSTGVEYTPQDSCKVEDYELSSSGPSNNNSASHIQAAKRNRASRRVVMNLCTVFIAFICCWMPVVSIYTIDFHSVLPASVYHILYIIAVSNSCLNVFIYAGMNRIFRRTYSQILTCRFSQVDSTF
ncbi:G-protein coupled receptor moody-like [Watersipora subatra]|uniref:G-protein coupled receptor moody-like n=1 Tax=Watersipora subatra TaxID=2589382 RepID=UPI00355B56A3